MKTTNLITLFLFFSIISISQNKPEMLDSLFSVMNERGQFYGNVLIAEHNKIIFSKSYGFADREKKESLNDQTLFNIGSVSYAFTAIAILQLTEKKKLKLTDKVKTYIPDFPYPDITIQHLLIHAGGLPDAYELLKTQNPDNSRIATNADVMAALIRQKPELQFRPGLRSEYNNLGYVILAEIVKIASGTDFKDYLQNNIFIPANMTKTGFYNAEEIKNIENVAKGYVLNPFSGKYEEAITMPEFSQHYVTSGLLGNGNIYSTAYDLYHFYNALSENALIKEESLNTAFQTRIPAHQKGMQDYGHSFGYGWLIMNDAPKQNIPKQIVTRDGGLQGYASNTIWDITDDIVVIYLINDYLYFESYQNQIPVSVAAVFYQNTVHIPKMTASIELTKIVRISSEETFSKKMEEIKKHPDMYQIDLPKLKFLVMKLKQNGETAKANLIIDNFKSE